MTKKSRDGISGGPETNNVQPWDEEKYHDDSNFEPLHGAKHSNGRARLTRSYAAALMAEGTSIAKYIATRLRSCVPGSRCGEGICPLCTTATRNSVVEAIWARFGTEQTALLTIVPSEPTLQHKRLRQLDIGKHKKHLRQKLSIAGLADTPMIGGLDLSWDTFEGLSNERFWSAHWHLIIQNSVAEEAKSRLSFLYERSLAVPVPLKIKPITITPSRAYSYCLKSVFEARHQRIVDENHRELRGASTITPKHTKFISLALGLHRIGIARRIFNSEQEGC